LVLESGALKGVRTYVGTAGEQLHSHFLPPPHYGQHTTEVLQNWLKLDEQAIQKLFSNGTVA
ncbi:MAG TPA: CoA transferase, partial [Chryseolinea sp.]